MNRRGRGHLVVRRRDRAEPPRQAVARGALAERPDRRERRLQPPRDRDRPAHEADRVAVRPHGRRRTRGAGTSTSRTGSTCCRRPTSCRRPRHAEAGSARAARAAHRLAAAARVAPGGGRAPGRPACSRSAASSAASSSDQVLLGTPGAASRGRRVCRSRPTTRRPRSSGSSAYLFGGGQARLERRRRSRGPVHGRGDARGKPRRAALRPRRRGHRPNRLPRRRIHGQPLRDGRAALPARSRAARRRAASGRPAVRGRRCARREALRRRRGHDLGALTRRLRGRPDGRLGPTRRDASLAARAHRALRGSAPGCCSWAAARGGSSRSTRPRGPSSSRGGSPSRSPIRPR